MKSIHDFTSYRDFLRSAFLREKRSSRKTTLALYARSLGMSSSALAMVFSGQRNLTVESIHDVAVRLRLSQAEHEAFEAMALREQSPRGSRAQRYYAQKLGLIARASKIASVRVSDRELLSDWLVPALLVYLMDVGSRVALDPEVVSARFGVAPARARALVASVEKSGLVSLGEGGQAHVVFEKIVGEGPQKNYVKAVLGELARRVEHDFKSEDALYRAFVLSIRKDSVPVLRRELMALFEAHMAAASKNPDENTIVQALVGMFPVLSAT